MSASAQLEGAQPRVSSIETDTCGLPTCG